MKQLLKITLGGCLSMIVAGIFGLVFFIGSLGALVSGSEIKTVQEGSVLHIDLDCTIADRGTNKGVAKMFSGEKETLGMNDIIDALRVAATDENIAGVFLSGGSVEADYATCQEIRKALVDFKKSGKFIASYADLYTQGSYYLASVADKVMLNPSGIIDWHGIASQPIFFKDLLDKVGVKMQVFKVGTYKSAVEPYILTGMSDANREQVESMISDIWGQVVKDVAASRKVKAEALNAIADDYAALKNASYYVKHKLVDKLCYIDQAREELRTLAKTDELCLVTPSDVVTDSGMNGLDDQVAVYYAMGDIVDAESKSPLISGTDQIVGSKVVEDLDVLMNDKNVKAVVIRVNSGGGSAYASEQMWHAIEKLKAKKPVVVSMGGMAASGGYYMSCGANKIFADATTLTGSIGIFGMVPDPSGLLTDKLGLHFDMVKTNRSSDFGTQARGLNEDESKAMQSYIERGYDLFLTRVATGRKMKKADVDKIAQGRVWTGNQALKLKLVDSLGGLPEAIECAAKLAKVKDYDIVNYPDVKDPISSMLSEDLADNYFERKAQTLLGDQYRALSILNSLQSGNYLQARILFVPNLK